MKVNDILKKEITVIGSATGYRNGLWTCKNMPLGVCLGQLTDMIKDECIHTASLEYHSDEQKEAKNKLPRYYIVGTFDTSSNFNINDKSVLSYSNLMTIDIDEKDNEDVDIWALREKIFEQNYVFSLLKSVSGHGYYAIIPIEDGRDTKSYYSYIAKLWKKDFNLNVDKNACSLTRARILSWDDERDNWIKKDEVSVWWLKDIEEEVVMKPKPIVDNEYANVLTHLAMWLMVNDGYTVNSYGAWYHIGCEFANFNDGDELFLLLSRSNSKYNDSDSVILKKYKNCIPTGITEDLHRKWQGMARNRFGKDWMKVNKNILDK